jgi:hypothetical protein
MKRLILKTERLRALTGAELEHVFGGMATDSPQTPPNQTTTVTPNPSAGLTCMPWPEPPPTPPR